MALILTIASLALLLSFTCSLLEAALYAITPSQLEVLRQAGGRAAERLAQMRARIEEPIAAILTINTVSNTLGSSVCGALVAARFGGDVAVGLFAGMFTAAVLVVSEIVPKSLGVRYAMPLAPYIVGPLQLMIYVSWPVARASRALMRWLTGGAVEAAPSADEILVLTRLARRGGKLRPQELRWVENTLQLSSVLARDLMTPRTVVETLPAGLQLSGLDASQRQWVHTRLPVVEGDELDSIVGVVHGKDVFRAVLAGDANVTMRELAKPIEFVPETTRGDALLDRFIATKKHLLAVVDEYGSFEGIVTLEDVLEAMLGSEIVDEHDRHADMQQVAREQAAARAQVIQDE